MVIKNLAIFKMVNKNVSGEHLNDYIQLIPKQLAEQYKMHLKWKHSKNGNLPRAVKTATISDRGIRERGDIVVAR